MQLSKGDLVVNKAAINSNSNDNIQLAKLSKKEIEEKKKFLLQKAETEKQKKEIAANIKSIIIADRSGAAGEGTYKYTFDTIYQDQDLAEVAKKYYGEREGKV